jgi:hypothetical protein
MWGVFLMGLGVLFLLDRMGRLELGDIWQYWPAIFFFIGLGHLLFPSRRQAITIENGERRVCHGRHDRIDGVIWILIGVWFFANQFEWWGFRYSRSWPIMVMLIGVQTVLRALADSRANRKVQEVQS